MTLNPRLVSNLIQSRMGVKDDSRAAEIINMIPQALKAFSRKIAADPAMRPLLTTDKNTTTIAIGTNGAVNLVTGYDSWQFLLEYFDQGLCYWLPMVTATAAVATTVNVSGAGISGFNGPYTYRGVYSLFPYYNLVGQPDSTSNFAIHAQWVITNSSGSTKYQSNDITGQLYPWLSNWESVSPGDDPAPTVAAVGGTITITDQLSAFTNLDAVQFSTDDTLPGGLSALTTYYITDYTLAMDGLSATFSLSSTANGLTPVAITNLGSGSLNVQKMSNPLGLPLQRLAAPQQANLVNYLDAVFTYFYIQADTLWVLPSTLTGLVAFAVPYFPTTLAGLPDSAECERMFLDKLYELCNPTPNDAAMDGPK